MLAALLGPPQTTLLPLPYLNKYLSGSCFYVTDKVLGRQQ